MKNTKHYVYIQRMCTFSSMSIHYVHWRVVMSNYLFKTNSHHVQCSKFDNIQFPNMLLYYPRSSGQLCTEVIAIKCSIQSQSADTRSFVTPIFFFFPSTLYYLSKPHKSPSHHHSNLNKIIHHQNTPLTLPHTLSLFRDYSWQTSPTTQEYDSWASPKAIPKPYPNTTDTNHPQPSTHQTTRCNIDIG